MQNNSNKINKGKKNKTYSSRFLKKNTPHGRGEKAIYVRPEYHERLSKIVNIIGNNKVPLYTYLDNILHHHFELFEKAIIDDYNEKFKPIF